MCSVECEVFFSFQYAVQCTVLSVKFFLQFPVCSSVCSVECKVFSFQYAVQCAVLSVKFLVSSMQFSVQC